MDKNMQALLGQTAFSLHESVIPYITTQYSKLYLGDAVDTLNRLPAESVDIIFADPPYNLSNGGTTCHAGKRVSVNKAFWDASRGIKEDFTFHMNWIQACRRVLKTTGTIWISGTYHSIFSCGYALQLQGWHLLNDIVWFKPNAAPNLACRMFTASHETLLWAKKNKNAKHHFSYEAMKFGCWEKDILKKQDKQMRSVWAISGPSKEEKCFGKHPTQKPLALLDRIIMASCPPKGIVLDPFCGSGTTGVAALRQGHQFIGIDSERNYLQKMTLPRLTAIERGDMNGEE
jgi:site-specific DNA-methyltransferase (adenine-specific)